MRCDYCADHGCEYCRPKGKPPVDTLETPTPEQLDAMRHMLGIRSCIPKKHWGYRNHYAVSITDEKSIASMRQLVGMGLVEEGHASATMTYFHCRVEGCRVAGLSKAGIRRVGYEV
jgi:hypothetical protein